MANGDLRVPTVPGVNETVSPKPQKDYYVGGSSIGGVDKNTKISTGDTIKKTDE